MIEMQITERDETFRRGMSDLMKAVASVGKTFEDAIE